MRAPDPPAGRESVRGHRVFGIDRAPAVQRVEVTWDGKSFTAERTPRGWEFDGRVATGATADAIGDLVELLVGLRAIDVFRPRDDSTYGLDRPRGTITLVTRHRVRRLVLGGLNSAGSAFYARRDGNPRVAQVGTLVGSAVERVLYHHAREERDPRHMSRVGAGREREAADYA